MTLSIRLYNQKNQKNTDIGGGAISIPLYTGQQSISFLFGHGCEISITILTDRQTSLVDNDLLPTMTIHDNGTYVLQVLTSCIDHAPNQSVILWIPGRNDVFMHPHVARMMLRAGYDVCVYNYAHTPFYTYTTHTPERVPFETRKDSYLFGSHVPTGSFDGLIPEIDEIVDDLYSRYTNIVVYAHSTGATILVNYLLAATTNVTAFQGLYLNSPFLGWDGEEEPVDNLSQLPPETVLKQGGQLDWWRIKIHTRHEYDLLAYQQHITPHLTAGFVSAVQKVFTKLEETSDNMRSVLSPAIPVCMITAKNDEVLQSDNTIRRSAWIGRNGKVPTKVLEFGAHDVFLSPRPREVEEAMVHLGDFLDSLTS
jgi:alpha-beta hydrolase superfamily lysophospholipase